MLLCCCAHRSRGGGLAGGLTGGASRTRGPRSPQGAGGRCLSISISFPLNTISPNTFIGMASSSSSPLQPLHSTLLQSFSSPHPDLPSIGTQLTKLKIALTQRGLLAPRPDDASLSKDDLVLARDVLEVGAFWSIRVKDVKGFKRYLDLLRGFYTDLAWVSHEDEEDAERGGVHRC